jgi:glutamate carboxypeptidase
MNARALRDVAGSVDLDRWLADLRALVAIDSGTDDPAGVNAVLDVLEGWMRRDGWSLERSGCRPPPEGPPVGDLLVGRLDGRGSGRVLLVGHADTVFGRGTASARPLRVEGERALGPGVCDMKGGLVLGLAAVRGLRDVGAVNLERVTLLITPDEEIGSPGSRERIRAEACEHDVAFVLEAAREDGSIVSSRKGVSTGLVRLRGRAAHAGVEPERGRHALVAAARLLLALQGLNDPARGTTVNVGTLRGGTRPNVVPEVAEMEIDVRAVTLDAQERVEEAVRELVARCWVEGVEGEVRLVREHAPMERTAAIGRLVGLARRVAAELGFDVREASTGGCSDANTIAALGVPTLDGLGPVGGDDHSDREWIDLASVPARAALLAGLIARGPAAVRDDTRTERPKAPSGDG